MQGFTLIELSIVLVIIGLIVAGVSAGSGLIEAGKERKEISLLQGLKISTNTFRLKYDALPGDFSEANEYWSSATSGDGDGQLERADGATELGSGSYGGELPEFFSQITLAGVTKQQYDNSNNIGFGFPESSVNEGKGIIAGENWQGNNPAGCSDGTFLLMTILNHESLPDLDAADSGSASRAYTPRQAKILDQKLDDGLGDSGNFISVNNGGTTTGTCHDNGDYDVERNTGTCRSCYRIE